ncbi:hypothetical protein [Fructobacillus pseudoficulneus]|nr:hypothetical protein [Fructobacillus pseudoficulneus]
MFLTFLILSAMLRFNSSILEVVDMVVAIFTQTVAQHLLFLAIPADIVGNLRFVWLAIIIWAFFLRSMGYKVGSWWSIATATALFLGMLVWSAVVFLNWRQGWVFNQTMPELSLTLWVFLLFQVQNILIQRLRVANWVKKTIAGFYIITWVIVAGNKIVGIDLSFTTAWASTLLGYVFFRFAAALYLRNAKSWLVIFAVDGKI